MRSLAAATEPGGRCFVLCFSELQPGGDGPRRVSQHEIRDNFANGWSVEAIDAVTLETAIHVDGVKAWRADIRRT